MEILQEEYLITLSAGTTHKPPPLGDCDFPIFESIAAADYLIKQGINPEKILPETSSYDTIGNAYFSRAIHVQPRQWKRLLVITSDFHFTRTKSIFQWVYGLGNDSKDYQLDFEAVTDAGIDSEILKARQVKERESLEKLSVIQSQINDLQTFHKWLFEEHAAYAVSLKPKPAKDKQQLELY